MKKLLTLISSFIFIYSCTSNNSNQQEEKNKAIMRDFYDKIVNAHNADMVDTFFAADFTDPQIRPGNGQTVRDLIKASFKGDFFTAFPDGHADVHYFVASGDTVVAQLTLTGTNTGPLKGMPATNRKIHLDEAAIFVLRDGKIIHRERYFNDLDMLQQLGLMPNPQSNNAMQKDSIK